MKLPILSCRGSMVTERDSRAFVEKKHVLLELGSIT